jgi:hypothetical protein
MIISIVKYKSNNLYGDTRGEGEWMLGHNSVARQEKRGELQIRKLLMENIACGIE